MFKVLTSFLLAVCTVADLALSKTIITLRVLHLRHSTVQGAHISVKG
jgi:hypothetical protein